MLAGFEEPDEGEIRISSQDVPESRPITVTSTPSSRKIEERRKKPPPDAIQPNSWNDSVSQLLSSSSTSVAEVRLTKW